jgi:DNA-binding CsgD family transcriptional regulator
MNLSEKETSLVFSIMRDLTGDFEHSEVRQRVGVKLLDLLDADYFASYVWDTDAAQFQSCVQINMSRNNLSQYEQYYQFHDPITPTLQRRRRATPVSHIMSHDRLVKTEFYNDFLKKDGLCFGLNFFAYDQGDNIGDVRIWRSEKREDFTERDAKIIDAVGPSFVNALVRANKPSTGKTQLRFSQVREHFKMTARQVEVADLLVLGLSDDEICQKLGISKPTLRTHISSIFEKTGLNRRNQLAQMLSGKNHH